MHPYLVLAIPAVVFLIVVASAAIVDYLEHKRWP